MACVALFNYAATTDGEITLWKDTTYRILQGGPDKHWWRLQGPDGSEGYGPSNYVRVTEPGTSDKASPPGAFLLEGTGGSSSTDGPGLPYVGCAMFSFTGSEPDELSLEVGDTVVVLEEADDGWARGTVRDGVPGWFPRNHLERKDGVLTTPVLSKVRSLYNFASGVPDELVFRKGELLEVSAPRRGGGALSFHLVTQRVFVWPFSDHQPRRIRVVAGPKQPTTGWFDSRQLRGGSLQCRRRTTAASRSRYHQHRHQWSG